MAGGATAQVESFSFGPLVLVCWQSSPAAYAASAG